MHTHPLWRPFAVPTEAEIAAARVQEHRPVLVEVVAPDPTWPQRYAEVAALVRDALGERVLAIEHVGSTSVPGLHAKPYLDVDLTVPDSAREEDYLPALEARGFRLTVREPEWDEHRCLKLLEPDANLHVWSPGAQEPRRHAAFRDWLATHTEDHAAYAALKRSLAERGFTDSMLYNNEKAGLIYDIYERIFATDPEHLHTPRPREPRATS